MNDKLGFATHFQQHWTLDVMPRIVDSGAGWIRDTIAWPEVEATKGVYSILPRDDAWLKAAAANNLKVVACFLYRNALYTDPYDPTGYANAVAWFAKQCVSLYPAVQQIEILNEPNNDYQAAEGATWVTKYIALCNQAYAAIKAVAPGMTVIGGGAQLAANLQMLSGGIKVDYFTDHPYPSASIDARTVWEDSRMDYQAYRAKIAAATSLPIEETEFGLPTGGDGSTWNIDENSQAIFLAQRIIMSQSSGVSRTFFYDFKDEGFARDSYTQSGIWTVNNNPKQAFFIFKVMSGLLNNNPVTGPLTFTVEDSSTVVQGYLTKNGTAVTFNPEWWTGTHPAKVTIPWAGSANPVVAVIDPLIGSRAWQGSVTVSGGSVVLDQFPVNPMPQFITLSVAPASGGGPSTPTLSALLKELISIA